VNIRPIPRTIRNQTTELVAKPAIYRIGMRDLTSPRTMIFKAALFLVLATLCGVGLWLRARQVSTLLLIVALAWSAARAYYFLFYVLHTYVDPTLKYSGLFSLVGQLAARQRSEDQ